MDSEAQTPPKSPRPVQRPSLRQLVWQFVCGCGYLVFAAAIIAAASAGIISTFAPQEPDRWALFARTLAVLAAGTVLILLVLLIWLAHWATGRQGRRRQFGLVSVFLVTALLAAYLALVRWLAVGIWPNDPPLWGFATIGLAALFLLVVGFIPLLGWMNSLVWFAAWLVRTPLAQRWLFGRRRP